MSEKTPLLPRPNAASAEASPRRGLSVIHALRVFGAAAALGLVYYSITDANDQDESASSKLCLTPACVHAASEILYNLSPNYKELDPCNDFEELVCGGWRDRHDLRPDQGDAFTGTIMNENSELLLRHILDSPYPRDSQHSYFSPMNLLATQKSADEENFDKMKAAYDACLDEDKVKNLGTGPLLQVLDEIKTTYPADDPADLKEAILLLAKYGVSALVTAGTGADDRDPDTVVVSVSAPWSFGLPSKERYEDEKLVEKYRTVAVEVLDSIYPNESKDAYSKVIDLEKKLAAASPPTEDREDVTKYYNPMPIGEAANLTPQVDLESLIHGLAPGNVDVGRVIVMTPDYQKELSSILNETDAKVLQSYFIWKAVQSFSAYIEADAIKPYKRFTNELVGKDPDSTPERWRRCVGHIDDGLGWFLSRFFVEKAFSAEAKTFGDTIINDIKAEFAKKLKAAKWVDNATTKKGIDKVHNIVQKIGYPTQSPDIMDPANLKEFYSSVNISMDTFFANALSVRRFAVGEEWSALGKPVDRAKWGMTVPTVNAYYNPPGNEIVFPAGIMQFPVFDVEVPAYMSYGAFGSVAGHELSHAFDSTGRHYDQTGNYTDWWQVSRVQSGCVLSAKRKTIFIDFIRKESSLRLAKTRGNVPSPLVSNETVKAFEKRAECFVDQYAGYTVPGPDDKPLHVNGRLTLGENIADAGGLSASFQAWKRRAHKKPNQDLPGLDHFTQDQLFFVSYSNWWCGKTRKETAIQRIYTDPHAPKWARILGTMANSREFRESFKCKEKQPTCQLW